MSAARANSAPLGLERFRALFEQRFGAIDALQPLRRKSLDRALATGFPTQRHEQWKYTNLRRIESRAFTLAAPGSFVLDPAHIPWAQEAGYRIVFVNGHWAPAFSTPVPLPPGATIVTLGEWVRHDAGRAFDYLSQHAVQSASFFEDLNTAFTEDGVVIELGPNTALDMPIHLVHVWTSHAQLSMAHPRILIRAGAHSRCALIEQFVGLGEAQTLTNAVTQLQLYRGARLDHYLLQQQNTKSFHVSHVAAAIEEGASYANYNFALGSAIGRTTLQTSLRGEHGHVSLRGLFLPAGAQLLDTYTSIEHAAAHTASEEDYRGIATDRARGVFNGKILVRSGAQKTDARQSSRNLLLAGTAEIDAKPELEIYANDVKCSHGATVGQLDPTALFYLRSRGLSEVDARVLLIRAFAHDVLARVQLEPLRTYLERQLQTRFDPTEKM